MTRIILCAILLSIEGHWNMLFTYRKALLLTLISVAVAVGLEPEDAEKLPAAEYLQFTDLDGDANQYVQWNKENRKWLFVSKDQTFSVFLSAKVNPGYQYFLNDQPIPLQEGGFQQRIGILAEPSQVTLKIIDDKNELHLFRSVYAWRKMPPSISLSFKEEGSEKVTQKTTGFTGHVKSAAFTQLLSHQKPTIAVDLDSEKYAGLSFQITFPQSTGQSYDGWRLLILNKEQRLVAEVKREGPPPLAVDWSEVKSKLILPGTYYYRTDLYRKNKLIEGTTNQFDSITGRGLASLGATESLIFEPKEELGYFSYRNHDSIGRSNLYFGADLPVIFSQMYVLRAQGLFSSISSDPANSLTTARVGAGMRLSPSTIDPDERLTGRLDMLLSYWTMALYQSAPVERVSHASVLFEPNMILWGKHYVIPSLELSASPSMDSMRTALGMSYQFFVRPWNVKIGLGTNFESLWKHDPEPRARHTLFRMMGTVTFLI